MNLVDGVTTFPVPVGSNTSLARSKDTVRRMEAVSQGDLAAVVARNCHRYDFSGMFFGTDLLFSNFLYHIFTWD